MIQLILQGIVEWKCVSIALKKSKELLEIRELGLDTHSLLSVLFETELASSQNAV